MGKSIKRIRNKLQLSHIAGQKQLLSTDIDLTQIAFITRRLPTMRFEESVVDGDIVRTIEGASTVNLTVNDRYGFVGRSGRLAQAVDIKLDGLWFRLVKVAKTGDNIDLNFESREVAVLRTYNDRRVIGWGKMRRARFAQILVQEVKEFKIPFICPDLKRKRVEDKDKEEKAVDRDPGFGFQTDSGDRNEAGRGLTIKGRPATTLQLNNCEEVLDVGLGMLLKRKLLVCSIMTTIQEASALNLPYGDRDSVGMFQQRPSQGWHGLANIKKAAREFFEHAIDYDRANPNAEYYEVCQAVQRSAYPKAYAQWKTEAEKIVTAYGVAGGDIGTSQEQAAANNMGWQFEAGVDDFQFMRGRPKTLPGGKKGWEEEDSWTCLQRLADEVNWRCFEVSGSVYFTTETHLFKSAPRARLSEASDGVDWIDYEYDIGKHNAQVEIRCRLNRWALPPGSVVEVYDAGPANGRWLVTEVRRSIFDPKGTIVAKKPRPRFSEPKREDLTGLWDNSGQSAEYVPTPGFRPDTPGNLPKGNALRDAVLNNPKITFTRPSQQMDIKMGLIDEKLLRFMVNFTEAGFDIVISALKSDHKKYSRPGHVSDHFQGEAVDMKNYTEGNQARTRNAMNWIRDHQVELEITQMIGPIDELVVPLGNYDRSTLDAHDDHIHVAV